MSVIRKIWNDPVWSKIIATAITALIAGPPLVIYRSAILQWLQSDHQTAGWLLATLVICIVIGLGLLAVLARRLVRRSRAHSFRPVVVQDRAHAIEWRIQDDPKHWANVDSNRLGPEAVREILVGPFHLTNKCHQEVQFLKVPCDRGPDVLRTFCPRCEDPEDIIGPEEAADEETVRDVRFQAVKELQRMHRAGTRLIGTVVLERPQYWRRMAGFGTQALTDRLR